jgi:hypothetical protein
MNIKLALSGPTSKRVGPAFVVYRPALFTQALHVQVVLLPATAGVLFK